MKEFLAQLAAIPTKSVKAFNGAIDGVAAQIATAKGSIVFLVVLIVVADVALRGGVGVIGYTLDQAKIFFELLVNLVKTGGWQLIMGLAIVLAFTYKK